MQIQFIADSATVTERMSDNSYKVQLFTGEYEQKKMAEIMLLPKEVPLKVTIEIGE